MQNVIVKLETKMIQDGQSDTFSFVENGTLAKGPKGLMLRYRESGQIPVKLVLKEQQVELTRGLAPDNYSKMRFVENERTRSEYVAGGQQMDIDVLTKKISFTEIDANSTQIIVEYDLYSGLYLVGNYIFKLIFGD